MLLEEEEDEVQEVEMMKVEDLENAVKQKFSNQVSCESTLHIFIYILTLYILIFILCLLIFVLLPLDF